MKRGKKQGKWSIFIRVFALVTAMAMIIMAFFAASVAYAAEPEDRTTEAAEETVKKKEDKKEEESEEDEEEKVPSWVPKSEIKKLEFKKSLEEAVEGVLPPNWMTVIEAGGWLDCVILTEDIYEKMPYREAEALKFALAEEPELAGSTCISAKEVHVNTIMYDAVGEKAKQTSEVTDTLSEPVSVSFHLPDTLWAGTKDYLVACIYEKGDGTCTAELHKTRKNRPAHTITFDTDRFGTFAVIMPQGLPSTLGASSLRLATIENNPYIEEYERGSVKPGTINLSHRYSVLKYGSWDVSVVEEAKSPLVN